MRLASRDALKLKHKKNYKRLKKGNRKKGTESANFSNTLKIGKIPKA
jgi:hypothetical protein